MAVWPEDERKCVHLARLLPATRRRVWPAEKRRNGRPRGGLRRMIEDPARRRLRLRLCCRCIFAGGRPCCVPLFGFFIHFSASPRIFYWYSALVFVILPIARILRRGMRRMNNSIRRQRIESVVLCIAGHQRNGARPTRPVPGRFAAGRFGKKLPTHRAGTGSQRRHENGQQEIFDTRGAL
jgi:hypothetical protein